MIKILLLLLPLAGCATIRPILTDCAAPAVKSLVAANLDRGVKALSGAPDAWDGAVSELVSELGGLGVCVVRKIAATMPGSRPQSGEFAAPVDPQRDLIGQRARQWLQSRKYEVPQ